MEEEVTVAYFEITMQ